MGKQTTKRVTQPVRPSAKQPAKAKGAQRRNARARVAIASGLPALPAVKLKPIPALQVVSDVNAAEVYAQLYSHYKQYCRVSKIKAQVPPMFGNPVLLLRWLTKKFKQLIATQCPAYTLQVQSVGMENKQYKLLAYYHYQVPNGKVYHLPLQYLQMLYDQQSALLKPVAQMYGWLLTKFGFGTYYTNWHYEYCIERIGEEGEELIENFETEEDIEQGYDFLENADIYASGLPYQWVQQALIAANSRLNSAYINRVMALQGEDEFIREWLADGAELLMHKDAAPLQWFQCEDEVEHYDGDMDPVNVSDVFIMNWGGGDSDNVINEFCEVIGQQAGNAGEYNPLEWRVIDGKVKTPLQNKRWFIDMVNWIGRGCTGINARCEDYNNKQKAAQ